MKFFSSWSALVMGLALTSTTTAFAQPDPDPAPSAAPGAPTKPKPVTTESGAATADAPVPAPESTPATADPVTPAPPPAPPSINVGREVVQPASDAPTAALPTDTKTPKPRPFAGSSLYVTNSMTTGTIFRGQTQDYNPTVESSLWLLPRYAINEAFQLRGRVVVSYEYTNSDSTTYRNEPLLSDTTLQLFYRKVPELPLGIKPSLALNVGVPTSKLSRSRTQVVAPGATLQLLRPFEHVLGGEGAFLGSVVYTHPFYQSRTSEVLDPRPAGSFQCMGGNGCQDLVSGTMNPSDSLSYSLLVEMQWGKWNPALYYLGATQWVYTPKDVMNPIDGTPVGSPAGFGPTSVRQTHYFSAWLDYNFNSWLTGEVGFWNSTSAINGAGERSNPIFNRYGDTRVYFGASFQLDNLVKALQGRGEGEAGVVRAKNQKQPMWTF